MIPQPTLYNQTMLDDDDFVASFVARRYTLETMCRRLKSVGPGDDGQHQMLIGTRGMGKTSLLRRLGIEIKRDHDLSVRFVPLMFREEQYNVLRLRDFWRNCGEALAEWAESQGRHDLAERLDDVLFSGSWESDEGAAEQFEAEMQALGKRAVLLIDNLDLILDALRDEDRWSLRASLQARGGPILVGAATQALKESANRDAAFYEFFQPYYLEPLELKETETCMRALASQRGEVGRRVLHVMHTDPARLRVLHRLTGGNPRVLALTYRLLETEDSRSAMVDLERLLDEVTPYYKARVEEYQTPLQRAIIDGIALHWDPITTGQLSDVTGVPTTTLSPQLIRLRNDGLIESIETSGSYAGHQVVERFLNIWYLMRHGTRRARRRMRWLVAFLSSFYCKDELEEIGRTARAAGHFDLWTRDYVQAFEQATQIAPAREPLGLKLAVPRHDDIVAADYRASPEAQDAKEMADRGISLNRNGEDAAALKIFEEVIAHYGSRPDPQVKKQVARAMLSKGVTHGHAGDYATALETFDAAIARFGDSEALPLQEQVARAMVNKGITQGQAGDPAAALETFDAAIARFGDSKALPLQEQVARALVSKGITLGQADHPAAELETYDALIARFGDSEANSLQELVARAMVNKVIKLGQAGDHAAELETYEALIARFGDSEALPLQEQVARAMVSKGITLGKAGDPAAALETFDALIARFGDSDTLPLQELVARAMFNKGITLGQAGDPAAELETYEALIARFGDSEAIPLQEQVARAMFNKGISLGQAGDPAAELETYEALIARFGDSEAIPLQELAAGAMVSKGITQGEADDPAAALKTFDALIARFGDSDALPLQELVARAMLNKGIAQSRAGDPSAELETYDALITRFGDSEATPLQEQVARAMVNKGITQGQAGDPAAALETYGALIARFGDSEALPLQEQVARAMVNKGLTLGRAGDLSAEIEIYDTLITRFGDSEALTLQEQVARAKVSLANRLIDTGADTSRTEALLKSVTESHNALAYGNLFWLYVSSREFSKARETLPHLEDMPTEGRALMDAALAIQAENFGDATKQLGKALQGGLDQESWNFTDDLERLLRLAIAAGFGERLINWFEETRLADRYAPIHVALKAAVHGEARLLDVNPETRHAAGLILRRLLPASNPRISK